MYACALSCFGRVCLSTTPWTAALQAPLSMGFSRQGWSGLPFPSPGGLPDSGIKSESYTSALAGGFFTSRTLVRSHSRLLFFWTHQVSDSLQLDYFWFCPKLALNSHTVPVREGPELKSKELYSTLGNPQWPQGQTWNFKSTFESVFYLCIYFWLCWVFTAACGPSLIPLDRVTLPLEHMGFSLRWFSCCGAQALGCVGSVVMSHGLSCPAVCGIFLDQGSNPCPLHW